MTLSYFLQLILKKLCETFHVLDKIKHIGIYVRMAEVMIIYDHNFKTSENPDISPIFTRNENGFHVIKCIFNAKKISRLMRLIGFLLDRMFCLMQNGLNHTVHGSTNIKLQF